MAREERGRQPDRGGRQQEPDREGQRRSEKDTGERSREWPSDTEQGRVRPGEKRK